MEKPKFYITTPIYYPSDKLHIGHTYCTVAADTIARYKRLRGYDVFFLTGTDEHGQKIERKAQEAGKTPQEYVDEIVASIKDLWKLMNISYDDFIRTTEERHKKVVQKIFTKLYEQGDIYKSEYEGWYCTPCESFWLDRQLVDGKCPDCGRPVERAREESYFFRLSKYQDALVKYIEEHPDFIVPQSRANEMINNFIKPGLEDVCVSRTTIKWGISVPFDPKHVIYVWIDALSNYITALGYMSEDDSKFKKYWPADVHLVGKEIVRFHTIIWPAILMALGLPLPKMVFGHGWLLLEGGKMSKSKGNVVDPVILAQKYGVDSLRYFLLREIPFGADGHFSEDSLRTRHNSDLANDLGNLLSRTVAMIEKYFDGIIHLPEAKEDLDNELITLAKEVYEKVCRCLDELQFSNALIEIWKLIARANKYIDETMPWVLGRDKSKYPRLKTVLYNLAEVLRIVAILIEPFMPQTTPKILQQLGISKDENPDITTWESASQFSLIPEGTKVKRGDPIFPRIVEKEENAMEDTNKQEVKRPEGAVPADDKNEEQKEYITIDDFAKIELKVAKVLEAEKIEGADKLLKLIVDLGNEKRQIVAGIAKHYTPDELVGKKIVVVANLKPAKLRGVESQGMLLAASIGDELCLITPEKDIKEGARVK
ncbi:methionyl-tRNA synthetase [Caldicellulosiruptor bescii]|uniref:Methionine--tRNA ligase n=2 Tax=Caldicellulosiruptor bescii TaxID=31899 RepID=B9MMZ1_CALBD|nr:methionine--tRNA ligase [Caldicellulosiruptor bescii]ACM59447.1 methionyl-tRNA synthetase [Caldicellulosiruptor bescii DSM 6725]PBC88104.1 methionyl-tRNA synthetase [Caldicellulosiruptor bescii]PBC89801.1 methionyl-tRNA synthetase [Caldicellulosiruptor bescii]PBD04772.1 methionyl-tRNA synthetase [Caldicellulosiruptor bescii]PBD05597.1 methionyl-tRNA synthetase [Caldicellulosiruptor bescii]